METWDIQSWLPLDIGEPSIEEVGSWLPRPKRRIRRILLLADIHANWHALDSVLRDAQGRYDASWFLGDVAGYGPRPVECVRFLQQHLSRKGRWVVGNHDAGVVEEYRENIPMPSTPSREAVWTWKKHREELKNESSELYEWFKDAVAPERARPVKRKYGSGTQVFVHANLVDRVDSYLYPDDQPGLLENLRKLTREGNAWLLIGHTHMVNLIRFYPNEELEWLPITYGKPIFLAQGFYLINPGSVGQPRDRDWRAAYAILDVEHGIVTFYRVEYDVKRVQGEMQRAGYPFALIERLWTARIPATERLHKVYECRKDGLYPIA